MRDVIGSDELEREAPALGRRPALGRQRTGRWLAACALLAGGAVAGGVADVGRLTDGARSDAAGRPAPVLPTDPGLRASLAARPLGGRTVRTGAGARGDLRLEVRNGGAPLRLLSVSAEVPGVRFAPVVRPHGLRLEPDGRVELVLAFTIDDCALLRRTGRLVLRVEQTGTPQEVGLTVTHDREAGTVRQVALDRVLGACS